MFICLLVYVDDVLLSSLSQILIDEVRDFVHSTFTIKDQGPAKYFLGIEIARSSDGTVLSQRKYVLDILTHAGLLGGRTASTPLPPALVLSHSNEGRLQDPEPYRKLVGQLLYLNLTRPDVTYATQQLSQFVSKPTQTHWNAAQHVLRYLKGCPSLGVYIAVSPDCRLTAYSDADWGTYINSRQSLTGYCIFLGPTLLSWRCKKQQTVCASSDESEYRALSSTVREILWLTYLLPEFGITLNLPVPLYCDNDAALHITQNHVFHERTKHLDIDCHLARENYKAGIITPLPIATVDQPADIFTKSLSGPRFRSLLSKMALADLHNAHLTGGC